MFSEMIAAIQTGTVDRREIGRRLHVALIKKRGVLQQPYLCRTADPKINPAAWQMLWAAVVLADRKQFAEIEQIIAVEIGEKDGQGKGDHDKIARAAVAGYVADLLASAVEPIRSELSATLQAMGRYP